MPSAAVHDRIALYSAGALIIPTYVFLRFGLGDQPDQAYEGTLLLIGTHLLGSWWLSPDLDLDGKIDDRWGPLRPIWLPYMKAVPHRHFVSHSGLSGFFRLVYLLLVVFGILAVLSALGYLLGVEANYHNDLMNWLWGTARGQERALLFIVAGVILSDVVHVVADVTDTRRKRRRIRRVSKRR